MAICEGIVRAAVETAEQQGATRVNSIEVTIGALTEVIEDALTFAFDVARQGTIAREATLDVTFLPARSRCLECSDTFTHGRFDAQCPACGSVFVELMSGRELRIDAIDID